MHDDRSDRPITFDRLGVAPDLVDVLRSVGIDRPFPIQRLVLPDGLAGRDVTGKAKTGSGKTLAFGLPLLQRLESSPPGRPHGLVLVPTRELALQVVDELAPLAAVRSLKIGAVYGGARIKRQIEAVRRGLDVAVATPGRLIDLMDRGVVSLAEVEVVVIDEADQMADMGFLPQVRWIMREVPAEHQTMLFSATLDGQVGSLVRSYLRDPAEHAVESDTETVETMEHRFLKVHHMDKAKVAAEISRHIDRMLVFVRTKRACDRVARDLRKLGVRARAIHGDLPQPKREEALAAFTDGSTPVLVATNIAARGLHVEGVDIVLHYDPPDDPKTYLHRSGRTARAGESGLVVTLVEWNEVNDVVAIQRRAGLNIPIVKMFSNDERLSDLAGWEPPPELAPMQNRPVGVVARDFRPRRRRRR